MRAREHDRVHENAGCCDYLEPGDNDGLDGSDVLGRGAENFVYEGHGLGRELDVSGEASPACPDDSGLPGLLDKVHVKQGGSMTASTDDANRNPRNGMKREPRNTPNIGK